VIITDIQELNWLRTNLHKLDKDLRGEILNQYRSVAKLPCVFQRIYQSWQKKHRRIPVIVQLAPMRGDQVKEELNSLLRKDYKSTEDLDIIEGFSAKLSVDSIQSLTSHSAVAKIYLDREVRALLDKAIPTMKAEQVWSHGYTGKNVTIAVLDTGISPHPDFLQPQKRIRAFVDLISNKNSQPYDDNGHGTHCAGAALGNGYNSLGKYKGPAYEAELVALKVLDKNGSGKASKVIKGLEWCLSNRIKHNIRIVSLSLGYKATVSYREDPVCMAVEKLWEAGIVVCVAAGNDGPETKTINSPGIHPSIITVGAGDDRNTSNPADDSVAEFSSRGPTIDGLTKPDFLAPGKNIISTKARGSYLDMIADKETVSDWYMSLSGTSMATPICAGIIAQLFDANPRLTPREIKDALIASCTKFPSVDANTQGEGAINALKALTNAAVTTDLTS
jgi:serine protease AprX